MAGTKFVTTIDRSGPFFTKDPGKTFRKNILTMMDAIAAEGEADVKAQLRSGNAGRAPISAIGDHVSEHAVGRTRSLNGKRWEVTAVVSVNNSGLTRAEGISLMAAASLVERRTHAFRRTAQRLRRARGINVTELLKGIA